MKPTMLMLIGAQASLCLLSSRSLSAQDRTSTTTTTTRTLERPTTTGAEVPKTGLTVTYPDVACSIHAWSYYNAWSGLVNFGGANELKDGTSVVGPVAIFVRVRVTNSTSAPAKNVPLSVSMTANGNPVKQAELSNPPADYVFYGTYPVPVATSIPLVLNSDPDWVAYEILFPKGLGQLGRENTYVLSINARLDQANSMREANDNNNECSKGIIIRYPAVPLP